MTGNPGPSGGLRRRWPSHQATSSQVNQFGGNTGMTPRDFHGWVGALGGQDGINVVAGTGSIAYGEWRQASARAGGWGELFSDEGSAYGIAREGLTLFSRMADGRTG